MQCASSQHSIYAPGPFGEPELSKYVATFDKRLDGRSFGSGAASFVMLNFPDHPIFPSAAP